MCFPGALVYSFFVSAVIECFVVQTLCQSGGDYKTWSSANGFALSMKPWTLFRHFLSTFTAWNRLDEF